MAGAAFDCFPDEAVAFLRDLKANNDRDWFAARKAVYEQALKRPAEAFCAQLTTRLSTLAGAPVASKLYRLHRDLRFAKDKTPYNPHLHVSFTPKGAPGGPSWFFGLEPERLVWGAGVFAFDKAGLEAWRARAAGEEGAALERLIAALRQGGARLDAPELKRTPPGVAADHPRAELLRRKGLALWIDDPEPLVACRPGFAAECVTAFERLKPLVDWLRPPDGK